MRFLVRVAAALGFLLIVISTTPVLAWWTDALSITWGSGTGDVLIVLGADTISSDMIGPNSYWRSHAALLEWRVHHYPTIIITGESAAPLMRDFMVSQGVPAQSIRVEDRAASTRENALFVADMLRGQPARKVLLTSDFHAGRATRAFRKAGLEVSTLPVPDVRKRMSSRPERWALFISLLTETAKVVYYAARGWT